MALTNEQLQTVLTRVQVLLPDETDEDLLTQLIVDADEFAEAYCQRTSLPDGLLRTVGDLAIVAYNRRGTEGESARSEGGENYTFETAPVQIYDILNRYRLARVGGSYHETAETDQT